MNSARASMILTAAVLLFSAVGCGQQSARNWHQYGARFPSSDQIWSVSQITGDEQDVIVEGQVGEVCKTMGCWLTLRDMNGKEVFVQTKDHAFFVPRNAAGRTARVHGRAERGEVGVDQLKHFAEDAGRSAAEIAAIDTPIERTTFYADSVIILGDGLERAEPPVDR